MTTYKWTTEKGAQVELTINHIEKETINADGQEIEVATDKIAIVEFKMNGKTFESKGFGSHAGQRAVNFIFNGKAALVPMPEQTAEEIFNSNKKLQASLKAEKAHQEATQKVYDAMNK